MRQREIFITQLDKDRLDEFISVAETFGDHSRQDLRDLQEELERANIVSSKQVPPNIVTLNSKVLLRDMDTSEEMTYSLTFPKHADIAQGSISVLAPIGTAILGYREGDVIE